MSSLLLILGNQLFPREYLAEFQSMPIYMAEDLGLCSYQKHHKQKILLFLSSMRSYADDLRKHGFEVHYRQIAFEGGGTYEDGLEGVTEKLSVKDLWHFEIEDKFFETRLTQWSSKKSIELKSIASPMFFLSREGFKAYLSDFDKPQMASFYRQRRLAQDVLLTKEDKPRGGKWSLDAENRKKLPKDISIPEQPSSSLTEHSETLIPIVNKHFFNHPGSLEAFAWPTTRRRALAWLNKFLQERFSQFGDYQDALTTRSEFVFHSAMSPVLNLGLVTPQEVLDTTLEYAEEHAIPINTVEGFVRQLLGWREFVRGIYQNYSELQEEKNFWGHERKLSQHWYDGTTGIPPLDDAIDRAQRLGYGHHIERLMVVGNLMLLCEIKPSEAHRWFMEMFVDSSDWVMGPNVYGMALFSDGGLFATKPYICGSNYLLKMSDYKKGAWCDVVDGLYWRFIAKHKAYFAGQPRLSVMVRGLARMSEERSNRIAKAAEQFLKRVT